MHVFNIKHLNSDKTRRIWPSIQLWVCLALFQKNQTASLPSWEPALPSSHPVVYTAALASAPFPPALQAQPRGNKPHGESSPVAPSCPATKAYTFGALNHLQFSNLLKSKWQKNWQLQRFSGAYPCVDGGLRLVFTYRKYSSCLCPVRLAAVWKVF